MSKPPKQHQSTGPMRHRILKEVLSLPVDIEMLCDDIGILLTENRQLKNELKKVREKSND